MIALFAFSAGIYYNLPVEYFVIGFICLLLREPRLVIAKR